MRKLNFPEYDFRVNERDGKPFIFDPARKKFVALTPEEWVRQHVIQYLVKDKNVPVSLIKVESEFQLLKTKKRFDVAVFTRNGIPLLIVECKSTSVELTQNEMDQALRYNMSLKVKYLWLTNGYHHIFCQADPEKGTISQIHDLPVLNNQNPGDE